MSQKFNFEFRKIKVFIVNKILGTRVQIWPYVIDEKIVLNDKLRMIT